ncbi:MAG: hypothetical protein A2X12_00210 [Bacteroidetes bacterium GWE2_29_8]|nr:MAG: hypothetical protein A2X12_00210 [Bacteroidetes bacterium GWE2_29_8]OFY15384.1 MAG: hypothetical protein A2X02_03040 [Bacteroidetes bacterium GWF2_29_10]
MKKIKIIGLSVFDRIKEAGLTQTILTKYSHLISTRLGFHEVSTNVCSRKGFIILKLKGDEAEWDNLLNELKKIGGLEIKEMEFNNL